MLAGEIYEPGKVRLIDVSEPKLDGGSGGSNGRILFQPQLGCLCGSDLPYFAMGDPPYSPVVGHSLHEMIGTVLDTNGERIRPGDRVLCVPENQKGLQERFCVDEACAIPLEPGLSDEQAVLSQPLGTVVCGLKKLPNLVDQDVVVVGQGPIGQLLCAAFRNLGARRIMAVDPVSSRLRTSPCMGATAVIDPTHDDPIAVVEGLTGGSMADLVVDAVGHGDRAFDLCVGLCRHAGRILLFTLPGAEPIDLEELFRKNITLHTSVGPDFDRDFPLAMRWIREGRIDVTPIITHRFALDEIQKAYEMFRDRKDGVLKVFIEFPAGVRF